jgi:hypothetical protein
VSRWVLLLGCIVLQGCSSLTEVAGGVVGLEIRVPENRNLEVGESLQLTAVALDKSGNAVDAPITWQATSTTLAVDPNTGIVTGLTPGPGQVQAFTGTLASTAVSLTVIAGADTLILVGDSVVTVPAGVSNTNPLVVELQSLSPPGPVAARPVIYTVTSPSDVGPHIVELPGGVLTDTVQTGTDGAVSSVTLNRVNGTTQPDTAIVEVRAVRTHGAPVPGSGQRFIVLFQ